MYPGESSQVSFPEKLARIESWIEAIKFYEAIMKPQFSGQLSSIEVRYLLAKGVVPQIDRVVHSVSSPGLRRLYLQLGYSVSDGEIITPWQQFVDQVKSGQLLETWKSLRAKS